MTLNREGDPESLSFFTFYFNFICSLSDIELQTFDIWLCFNIRTFKTAAVQVADVMFFSFLFTCALSGNMKKRLLMPSRGKTLKLRSAYARRVIFSFICWLVCALWLMSLCAPSVLMSKCSLGNHFHTWFCCSPFRLFTRRQQVVQPHWRREVLHSELIPNSSSWQNSLPAVL